RDVPYGGVAPGLLIGRNLNRCEAKALIDAGVYAVLDLTAEYPETAPFRRLAYQNVPILDLTPPSADQLAQCVAFIREHILHGAVYVHCALGYSRGACVAAAYLLDSGN